MANKYYTDYPEYLLRFFPAGKVQKISVNTDSGCPNRDGTIGTGGCIYCNNASFTPGYCFETRGVTAQIEAGKRFFARKYPEMQYIAYFQSYTNTHRNSVERLERQYREAMACPGVMGLSVATRPDCLPDEVADLLVALNREMPVFVELGIETLRDDTLKLINRGHDSATAIDAIRRLAARGLHVGVHLIAGLPGETLCTALENVKAVCSEPVESIKLHHLQVLRSTPLHAMLERGELEVPRFSVDEYIDFCVNVIRSVPRTVAIERFLASAPPAMVVSPHWGLKNHEFQHLLLNRLNEITKS